MNSSYPKVSSRPLPLPEAAQHDAARNLDLFHFRMQNWSHVLFGIDELPGKCRKVGGQGVGGLNCLVEVAVSAVRSWRFLDVLRRVRAGCVWL